MTTNFIFTHNDKIYWFSLQIEFKLFSLVFLESFTDLICTCQVNEPHL